MWPGKTRRDGNNARGVIGVKRIWCREYSWCGILMSGGGGGIHRPFRARIIMRAMRARCLRVHFTGWIASSHKDCEKLERRFGLAERFWPGCATFRTRKTQRPGHAVEQLCLDDTVTLDATSNLSFDFNLRSIFNPFSLESTTPPVRWIS